MRSSILRLALTMGVAGFFLTRPAVAADFSSLPESWESNRTMPKDGTVLVPPPAPTSAPASTTSCNKHVLRAIAAMPNGGGYSVNRAAKRNLVRSVQLAKDQTLVLAPDLARPSFCSGATYLALLGALAEMEKQGMPISREAKERLVLLEHPDGEGIWGRWNANGPGTARLFQELRLGTNFTELEKAQPGDFLKLWWTDGIGAKERGHSVIFLGTGRADDGTATIRFWSSNVPDGFGEKTVSLSKVKHMVFSRLEHPERFNAISKLPMKDAYLASMLEVDESFSGMTKKLGLPGTR